MKCNYGTQPMMPKPPNLLILTVGTGTAGKHSNLAEGLRRTIEILQPRGFWLAPSASEDSQTIAELVAEGFASFKPLSEQKRYWTITAPDDLESCRATIREAIAAVHRELRPGEILYINPTSGTKQMTAAATLAALDENIGDICFTVGERADGVVKTGSERITHFDAAAYFRERDLALADELFKSGSFYAAARILKAHKPLLLHAHATASMCHHWRRFDYEKAASAAAMFDEDRRRAFSLRAQAVREGKPLVEALADILAWARFAFDRQEDYDETARLAYKAVEYAAKCRLAARFALVPDAKGFYQPDPLYALHSDFMWRYKTDRPDLALGLKHLMDILATLADDLGISWNDAPKNSAAARIRNEYTHSIRPVEQPEAQSLLDRAEQVIGGCFSLEFLQIPASLPDESSSRAPLLS
jgi:hypothetical protein